MGKFIYCLKEPLGTDGEDRVKILGEGLSNAGKIELRRKIMI